jgi:hypothetical protein
VYRILPVAGNVNGIQRLGVLLMLIRLDEYLFVFYKDVFEISKDDKNVKMRNDWWCLIMDVSA